MLTQRNLDREKRAANNKISSRNKAIAPVETIVTLLFYYHHRRRSRRRLLFHRFVFYLFLSPDRMHSSWSLAPSLFNFGSVKYWPNCLLIIDTHLFWVQCCVMPVCSVHDIFSRSFDICRSIENLVLWMRTLHQTNRRCTNKNIISCILLSSLTHFQWANVSFTLCFSMVKQEKKMTNLLSLLLLLLLLLLFFFFW